MKNRLLQAYKQAPWRVQLQWIGLFLLGLVLVAAIAGVYLNISEKAATAGRRIQALENDIEAINNEIAGLRTELAAATSTSVMMAKAEDLGFNTLDPLQALYLTIPGYHPEPQLVLAPPPANMLPNRPVIEPGYTSSLWDWLAETIWRVPESPLQIQVDVTP
jgi:hypothetical protein